MSDREGTEYYLSRKDELLRDFDAEARDWRRVLVEDYGDEFAAAVLRQARQRFAALIPQIPYIGGDENHLTASLIGAARYLALYQAMKARGKSAAETGRVLYYAIEASPPPAPIPPSKRLRWETLMARRRERARRSQERRYAWDWVYDFVEGDGKTFDYGYNYYECATQRFYRVQGAQAFLPFYCFLDFPLCERAGLGLTRTKTLAAGDKLCDFRFREGDEAARHWPPPFLESDQ
jgi:hypothetical protein